ncbi:MAG: ATP-binding protein [Actinomycetota bacterium]|nr:ATP-binding protein [Actinomycetota bacterium]
MDAAMVAAVTGLTVLVAALVGVLGYGLGRRRQPRVPAPVEPVLAPGVSTVLTALRSSAVVLGVDDRVLRASPAAYATGLVRGDQLVVEPLVALAGRVRRGGQAREVELELPRGPLGGKPLAVVARVAPLGTQGQVLVLVEDRTEAHRIDAVRRDFVANVSHELKTPVGAMGLLAEALLDASDDPEAVRRFAGRMQHEAARLSNLVQELIDLSRLQGDDSLISASAVALDEVVADAVDRSRLAAAAKSITLVTGGEKGLKVLGDERQLVTALRNLIDNAINYSPEHTRVAVAVRRQQDLAEISVTDQGIGIPARELDRIFERFYRVDPARSRATGGTGLGLAIVKHTAQNHGGEVTVWSVEDSGSTFTLRLPLNSPSPTPVPEDAP